MPALRLDTALVAVDREARRAAAVRRQKPPGEA